MAVRYETEFLLHLRESPLCVKPATLPPLEEWMGPPQEAFRVGKVGPERGRIEEPLLDQPSRRSQTDRLVTRNSSNPDDIVLGPPKMSFASSTLRNNGNSKQLDLGGSTKETDSRDRFSFRTRAIDSESSDRFRDGRTNTFRRRGDNDQDSDGWSTVKPRKSFGHEGAERFHGRMGAAGSSSNDRFHIDRRNREREDREPLPNRRNIDSFPREKDGEDGEPRTRNSIPRGKSDSWFKTEQAPEVTTPRERLDRTKNWREREKEADPPADDKNNGRSYERRWGKDRDQRVERDPEWMDEPAAEKSGGHTEEDFKKFMNSMKARYAAAPASSESKASSIPAGAPTAATLSSAVEKPKAEPASAPADAGPDKFFLAFGSASGLDVGNSSADAVEPKPASKPPSSSRFTSFFNAPSTEAPTRRQTEPPTPLSGPPNSGGVPFERRQVTTEDDIAFQQIVMKLERQQPQPIASPPAMPPVFSEPHTPFLDLNRGGPSGGPSDNLHRSTSDNHSDPRNRLPAHSHQQPMLSRPLPLQDPFSQLTPSMPAISHQEHVLQTIVAAHREQNGSRPDQNASRTKNADTEFLMNLMRGQPDAPRSDPMPLRMPQPHKQAPLPQISERESDYFRDERMSAPLPHQLQPAAQSQSQSQQQSQQQQQQPQQQHPQHPQLPQQQLHQQHQQLLPQGQQLPRQIRPAGFMDESFRQESDGRPLQPTQILQRPPPPPGLDQMPGPNWIQGGGNMPPPPPRQGQIIPPPGLTGGSSRNPPMPNMFPPNFSVAGFPPPDAMPGMLPPRNMQPPPGMGFGGPPPGFFPPPGMGFQGGLPGPDGHVFGVMGMPFDGRGMPPPGAGAPPRGGGYPRT